MKGSEAKNVCRSRTVTMQCGEARERKRREGREGERREGKGG